MPRVKKLEKERMKGMDIPDADKEEKKKKKKKSKSKGDAGDAEAGTKPEVMPRKWGAGRDRGPGNGN